MKLLIFIITFLVIFALTKEDIIADDSLVLHLTFDEGKGKEAKDSSKYGNKGTLEGGAEWKDGKYGKAVSFSAEGDQVVVQNSENLNIQGKITIMAWSKIDAWNGSGDQWVGKGAHASKPSCYGLMVYQSANVYFMLGDGGARHDLITPKLPNTGEWQHVSATYDGKVMKYYLNGELTAEKEDKFDFKGVNELPVMVGSGVQRPQYVFNGIIDEVAIFNRALEPIEIKKAMSGVKLLLSVNSSDKLATTWGNLKK